MALGPDGKIYAIGGYGGGSAAVSHGTSQTEENKDTLSNSKDNQQ